MFQSGFLIFLPPFNAQLIHKENTNDNAILRFAEIIINNKITLYSSQPFNFNSNSLLFLMIKLGIIYKENNLLIKGLNNIKYYDIKVANYLFEYILRTSQTEQIVSNKNDNFYLFIIKITIKFLISQIDKRTKVLEGNNIVIQSSNTPQHFEENKNFKEIVILTKYLDILRNINHSIFYNRKICKTSFSSLNNSLNFNKSNKDDTEINIIYLTSEYYFGNNSRTEYYIRKKFDMSRLEMIKKLIVEIYCCFMLQKDENLYNVCLKVLRNFSFNPTVFFTKVYLNAITKSLRRFLFNHLKHLCSVSKEGEAINNFMNYLESNYSNPSFEAEYQLKVTNILSGKVYKKDSLQYSNFPHNQYVSLIQKYFPKKKKYKINYNELHHNFTYFEILDSTLTVLNTTNINTIQEVIRENDEIEKCDDLELLDEKFNEIYDRVFMTKEQNEFGFGKNCIDKPNFIENESLDILQQLIKLFSENDIKLYFGKQNQKDQCHFCKEDSIKIDKTKNSFLLRKTKHLGYSNISIENLYYFNQRNIYRIKLDDYFQLHHDINIIKKYINDSNTYTNINSISSLCSYIFGHYKTEWIPYIIDGLFGNNNETYIQKDNPMESIYFISPKGNFYFLKDDIFDLFYQPHNLRIQKILFDSLSSKGILYIKDENNINQDLIKKLIKNNLFLPKKENKQMVKSKLDKCLEKFILLNENNYCFLQSIFDSGNFNPQFMLNSNYTTIDIWQKVILYSKLKAASIDDNIFDIAIENMKIFKWENSYEINNTSIFYLILGILAYLKKDSICSFDQILQSKTNKRFDYSQIIHKVIQLVKEILPNLFDFNETKSETTNFNNKNSICTLSQDIDILSLVNLYYPSFLNNRKPIHNVQKSFISELEIFLENGQVIEAYNYYNSNLSNSLSDKDLFSLLYSICFNNLLNQNIFAGCVILLKLIYKNKKEIAEEETKELIVHVEAANMILSYEINQITKSTQSKEKLIKLIHNKNYSLLYQQSELKEYQEIFIRYQELVDQFYELKLAKSLSINYSTLTADLLKRLEDAMWSDSENQSEMNRFLNILNLFCKMNNYEIQLTYLHELGRKNNWIGFLDKAQDQDCAPSTTYGILVKYFENQELKEHLSVIIEPLLKSSNDKTDTIEETEDKIVLTEDNDENIIITFPNELNNIPSYDPLYYLANDIDTISILSEALKFNYRDLIFTAMSKEKSPNTFGYFCLYLYFSLREILISSNAGVYLGNLTKEEIFNLKTLYNNKKKNMTVKELQLLIEFLLMHNYFNVLFEALELFNIPQNWTEFILFIENIFDDLYDEASIHFSIFNLLNQEEEEENNKETLKFLKPISANIINTIKNKFIIEKRNFRLSQLDNILSLFE